MIIAITGYKGSGKDTVADMLIEKMGGEKQYVGKRSFAYPIKEAAKVIFDWGEEHVNGDLKNDVDERWGVSPREILQWMGTEVFQYKISEDFPAFADKVGREIWVQNLYNWYLSNHNPFTSNIIIPDMRFPHELEVIKYGMSRITPVVTIRVDRESITPDDPHESEYHIPYLSVDFIIENNYPLPVLEESVDTIVDYLKTRPIEIEEAG